MFLNDVPDLRAPILLLEVEEIIIGNNLNVHISRRTIDYMLKFW